MSSGLLALAASFLSIAIIAVHSLFNAASNARLQFSFRHSTT
jgi:hypothetical protein